MRRQAKIFYVDKREPEEIYGFENMQSEDQFFIFMWEDRMLGVRKKTVDRVEMSNMMGPTDATTH